MLHQAALTVLKRPALSRRTRALAATGVLALIAALFTLLWTDQGKPPQNATATAASGTPCTAHFTVKHDWGDGFDATVTVADQTLSHGTWEVSFNFPGDQTIGSQHAAAAEPTAAELTSVSSKPAAVAASTRQVGARVTTTVRGHSITPGATVKFDLSGRYQSGNPLPTEVLLSGQNCATEVAGASVTPARATSPDDRGGDDNQGDDNRDNGHHGGGNHGKGNGDD
jgi:hypothetical protein